MNKRISKNMSDPESRDFWLAIAECARDKSRELTTERVPWTHERPEGKEPPKEQVRRPRPRSK